MWSHKCLTVVALTWAALGACAPQDSAALNPTWEEFAADPPMTWAQYLASAKPYGADRYIIEGDIVVAGQEAVRAAYGAWLRRAFDARDHGSSELRIATGPNGRVQWSAQQAQDLTYCVSDDFGANKPKMIAAMNRATLSWSARAKVAFRYVPQADANCYPSNPTVVFRVRPSGTPSNMTFYPDAQPAMRDLMISYTWFSSTDARLFEGTTRHDVGHILGFAHAPATCADPYDRAAESLSSDTAEISIMRSPCASTWLPSAQAVTDYEGAAVVYGASGGAIEPVDSAFATAQYGEPRFSETVEYPDVDGDGRSDICGVTESGSVSCKTAAGTTFTTSFWPNDIYLPVRIGTIHFADVSGDGKADVCGLMQDGLWCGLSQGTSFIAPTRFTTAFATWSSRDYYWGTLQFVDVNADGRMDLCGRGRDGIACALSLGTSFTAEQPWMPHEYRDVQGWHFHPAYWKTIRFPDLNGDGFPDVCGRGYSGILCGISTGTSFQWPTYWSNQFSDAEGWTGSSNLWTTFRYADLNGDGKDDLCARGIYAVHCALSDGTRLGPRSEWTPAFSNLFNGDVRSDSFQLTDLDSDGRADVCASTEHGVLCTRSHGTSFGRPEIYAAGFGANTFWTEFSLRTLGPADRDGDGRAEFCTVARSGVWCSRP